LNAESAVLAVVLLTDAVRMILDDGHGGDLAEAPRISPGTQTPVAV